MKSNINDWFNVGWYSFNKKTVMQRLNYQYIDIIILSEDSKLSIKYIYMPPEQIYDSFDM